MTKMKWSYLALPIALTLFFFSCSSDADSKPNYIFKPKSADGVAAKIGDQVISEKELVSGIESEIFEAEMKVYELKFSKLQSMLMEKFMNKDPKKQGLSNDEYLAKYIASEVKVGEKEIEKFIKEKQIPKEQINPDIKERIKQYIEMDAKRVAVEKWLNDQTKKNPVEVYLEKPKRPRFEVVTQDSPFKGNEDAKVTIVEYSDFQCPYCSKATKTVSDLEKKYGKKVKIVFKHFPLPFHNQAKLASEASMCANAENSKLFWKMHDEMFNDQTKLDQDNLMKLAQKIGLKADKFKTCLESGQFRARVEADVLEGNKLGIKSTPTFFVNGYLVSGAQPIEVFSEIIDEELSK